jgi:predicted nucleic acid-binding protein
MPGRFADTNVVLYATSPDARKAEIATGLLASELVISAQVLNEVAHVFRKRWRRTWDETHAFLTTLTDLTDVRPLDRATHDAGLRIAQRYRLNVYDGFIAGAALLADCDTLYSEDMHDGLLIEGRLRVINPFA